MLVSLLLAEEKCGCGDWHKEARHVLKQEARMAAHYCRPR